jgi:hypothetical protein
VGFEQLSSLLTAALWIVSRQQPKKVVADELRSWVQIPPGPSFPVMKLRYYLELVFS